MILPLKFGDPLNFDFQTPSHLIDAVYKACGRGKHGYSSSSGIPSALELSSNLSMLVCITSVILP